jgi:hypothetical protein
MSMTEMDRPVPESYWVLPGCLLAGEYPGHYDDEATRRRIDSLLEDGFDLFIDLTMPHEHVPYDGILQAEAQVLQVAVAHRRFAIGDFGLPTPALMNSILDAIDEGVLAGRKIYLHCWAGIGRTGTTVGCYLVRRGIAGPEALDQLAAWWQSVPKSRYHPHSPETSAQAEFVLHWAEHDEHGSGAA